MLWQREGTRYHTAVEMSAGLLASLSFTSQGDITANGLKPEVYEENVRGRRRGVVAPPTGGMSRPVSRVLSRGSLPTSR